MHLWMTFLTRLRFVLCYHSRMNPVHQWSLTDRGSVRNAWVLWAIVTVVVMIVVAAAPDTRSVTSNYRDAIVAWWQGRDLYHALDNIHGFLYLPQAAFFYAPFALLPERLGEPLARLMLMGLFAWGMWEMCRIEHREGYGRLFPILTLASLPLVVANARNGQFNLAMGGAFMLATASLAREQWWRVTLWLVVAVAMKPVALVMLLLAGCVWWRPLSWRLAVGMAVMLALPFALHRPDYVLRQYHLFFDKLATAGAPVIPEWYDINGVLANGLGLRVPPAVLTLIRAAAAVGTLGLTWLAARRFSLAGAALLLFTLTVTYLMLFNPRTEGPTYVLFMPAMGLFIGWRLCGGTAVPLAKQAKKLPAIGIVLILGAIAINFAYDLFNLIGLEPKQYWFRPLLVLAFAGYVTWVIGGAKTAETEKQENGKQ